MYNCNFSGINVLRKGRLGTQNWGGGELKLGKLRRLLRPFWSLRKCNSKVKHKRLTSSVSDQPSFCMIWGLLKNKNQHLFSYRILFTLLRLMAVTPLAFPRCGQLPNEIANLRYSLERLAPIYHSLPDLSEHISPRHLKLSLLQPDLAVATCSSPSSHSCIIIFSVSQVILLKYN